MAKRTLHPDDVREREDEEPVAEDVPPVTDEASALLALQRGAGNAAVSRMLAARSGVAPAKIQRWANLGTESWTIRGLGSRSMTVWTGSKEEWSSRLDNVDDEDEYREDIWGFLVASNDPGIVGRDRPPSHISSDPESVNYANTITRAPTSGEKLAFLQALYEKEGDLDLWHGGTLEGGPWIHWADADLAQFLRENQGLYLQAVSMAGRPISTAGVTAVAEQGGRAATMAMIVNAGATAHKGVDLVMTANRKDGREREVAHSQAMELIRNSGRTIRAALVAHDARVAFERAVVGFVFDQVWDTIPGGGTLVSAGKALLKAGLDKALEDATADDGPTTQAETINDEFVTSCNRLVAEGHILSADAQDAINGFEAVRR